MFTNNGHALLIGVDDYTAFDASSSQQAGTSDLPGSRNDVKLWWRFCREIGMKPEHIHVLASPPIPASELEGALPSHVGTATAAEILEKAAWLGKALGEASQPSGLLTYSGHGDWVNGKGLVLCPTDAARGSNEQLANVISFPELNERLAAHQENLTVVLDCCHSGPGPAVHGVGSKRAATLTRRPLSSFPGFKQGKAPGIVELAGRVLAAAKREQVAYQVRVDGQYHGVFSWALNTAIAQWSAVEQGHNVRFDVCYGILVEAAGRLMSALYLDQVPEVHGPPGVQALALLRRGLAGQPGETVTVPDRTAVPAQLDPGEFDYVIYTLTNDGGLVGQILVTATAHPDLGYAANTEYWYMSQNIANNAALTINSGSSMYWTTAPSGLGSLSFATARATSWTSGTPIGTMMYHGSGSSLVALQWNMAFNGSLWSGSMTWWHGVAGNVLGPNITNLKLSSGRPSGSEYYITSYPL